MPDLNKITGSHNRGTSFLKAFIDKNLVSPFDIFDG